jgi:hypothetical protein
MLFKNSFFFLVVGLVERIGSTQKGTQRVFAGTPTFCSLNSNRDGEPTARDDLEALVRLVNLSRTAVTYFYNFLGLRVVVLV